MWISIDSAAYLTKILNDGTPSHPDAYDFRYLESLAGALRLRKIVIGPIQEFCVVSTQRSFPRESYNPQYFSIPIQKEYVNEPSAGSI